ncbi:MAG: beta strand repeat-containing protein [Opitutaceae bacterium]
MKQPQSPNRVRCTLGAFILVGINSANADVLAQYDFNGLGSTTGVTAANISTSPLFVATASDTDVTASNITLGSGLTAATYVSNANEDYFQIAEAQGMSDGTHTDDGDITAFMNTAYAAGDYIEFTLNSTATTTLNLDSLTFDFHRAQRGVNDFAILTSVDGFASYVALEDQAASIGTFNTSTPTFEPIDLSAPSFQGLTTITFRIVFDDRQANGSSTSATIVDDIVVNGTITQAAPTWQTDSSGDWSTPENWSAAVPNAASAEAIFNDILPLTGPLTATLDAAVTLGTLNLLSAQPITVGGANTLTFDGGGAASVSATVGSHVLSAPVSLTDPLDIALSSGSTLNVSGALSGTTTVTNSGDGQLTLSGDLSGHTGSIISDAGTLVVSGTGASDITANAGTLEVSGAGISDITVAAGASLSGEGSHTGTLNLAAGSTLIVDPSNGTTAFTTGTLSPTAAVNVEFSSSPLGVGNFTMFDYTTYAGAVAVDFVNSEYRITFADTGSSITGAVAAAETSIWTALDGSNATYWDNGTSLNWDSSDSLFYKGDTVTFTDTSAGAVSVQDAVTPATVTFSNTEGNDYTLDDITANAEAISAETGGINVTGGGNVAINTKITGNTNIAHSGTGILTIGAGVGNDFNGDVTVTGGGTLAVGSNNFLGAVDNTITIASGSTLNLNGINSLTSYDPSTFIFEDGAILTNTGGTLNDSFSDQVQLNGNITFEGTGRFDIQSGINVTGSNIVITLENDSAHVIGGDNSAQSISEWIINDGFLFANLGTSSLGNNATVTVNPEGRLSGNTGVGFDNGSGLGITDFGNAITLNGGTLASNQANTTTIFSGTVTVTGGGSIDPDLGSRTIILSGTLTESGAGGDLTIGDGLTRFASTLDATGFTGDFIFNDAGSIELEDGVNLTQDFVIDVAGGNKQFRLLTGNSAEISGGITVDETDAGLFDLNVNDAADTLTVSGLITGNGAAGVTKTGAGTVILSGSNDYTGATTVLAGSLQLDGDSLLDSGSLVIDGGTVAVTGTETVGTLFIGAVEQAAGTYTNAEIAEITSGSITVVSGPASGFGTWASDNGLTGGHDAPTDDPDGDGSNLYEYFFWDSNPLVADTFGSELSGVDASGALSGTLVFSHDRPQDISDVTVTYQWTADLGAGWTNDGDSDGTNTVTFATGTLDAPANGNAAEYESVEVTATVTAGTPAQIFVRVSVTQP